MHQADKAQLQLPFTDAQLEGMIDRLTQRLRTAERRLLSLIAVEDTSGLLSPSKAQAASGRTIQPSGGVTEAVVDTQSVFSDDGSGGGDVGDGGDVHNRGAFAAGINTDATVMKSPDAARAQRVRGIGCGGACCSSPVHLHGC